MPVAGTGQVGAMSDSLRSFHKFGVLLLRSFSKRAPSNDWPEHTPYASHLGRSVVHHTYLTGLAIGIRK